MNIDYTVMSSKVIGAAAKRLKVEVKGDLVTKANALGEHFKKTAAKAKTDLYACTACGGLSDEDWPKCPYCGGNMEDDEEKPNDTPAVALASGFLAKENIIETSGEELATIADLDESVKKIAELKSSAAGSIWELGQAIRHNFERELWKLRMKGGKVAHTNYKKFCTDELDMSHTMAFNLMEVARQFSKQDIESVGVTKLSILARVEDPKKRAELLAAAKGGATVREIDEKVKDTKLKGEKAQPVDGPVTFVARTGPVQSFPMKRAADGEPATRIEAGIWCEEEHENGVVSAYSVEVEGELVVLRINRYRG